jgi:hypothetical protein
MLANSPVHCVQGFLTTSTSQEACPITPEVTLPMINLFMPLLPWVPIAIRSTPFSRAVSAITSGGSRQQILFDPEFLLTMSWLQKSFLPVSIRLSSRPGLSRTFLVEPDRIEKWELPRLFIRLADSIRAALLKSEPSNPTNILLYMINEHLRPF